MDTAILLISSLFVLFALLSFVVGVASVIRRREERKDVLERLFGKPVAAPTVAEATRPIISTTIDRVGRKGGYSILVETTWQTLANGDDEALSLKYFVVAPWGQEFAFSKSANAMVFVRELMALVKADTHSTLTKEGMLNAVNRLYIIVKGMPIVNGDKIRLVNRVIKSVPASGLVDHVVAGELYHKRVAYRLA